MIISTYNNNTNNLTLMTDNKTSTIIDPNIFQAILLDGIDQKLKSNNTLLESVIKIQGDIANLLTKINTEQKEEADEGKYRIEDGTASTDLIKIDVEQLLGHYIKGYTIINDGSNDIYTSHNPSNVSMDVFFKTEPNEKNIFTYNRNKIKTIYIKTLTGTSNYRLTLVW